MRRKELGVYEVKTVWAFTGKINMANLCLTVSGGRGADVLSTAVNKHFKEHYY